jgi:hypothetical protein
MPCSGRVTLLMVPVFTVGILVGCDNQPGGPAESSGSLVAYRSATEIGLVDGTSVIATAPGSFTASNDPIVSDDGRFVFARTADDKLAYALYRRSSDTCGNAAVAVTNADGSQQTFDVATADANRGSQIAHVWWPKTGPPKLSLATWQCDQPEPFTPLVWQLDGDRLVQTKPPTSALETADVAPGQHALIVPQGSAGVRAVGNTGLR